MPSQTVHLTAGQYQYVAATKQDGDSVSGRVRELVQKGIDAEENNE
jgi:hypothetical protein